MTSHGLSQLNEALRDRCERLARVRLCGIMDDGLTQPMVLVNDDHGTGSSFVWRDGETLAQALARVDRRYAMPPTAPAEGGA